MMTPITPMVKQLIIINIIFYVGSNFLLQNDLAYQLFSLYFPLTDKFHFWQIFTRMFMHSKFNEMFSHIVFNMLGLYMFGSALEKFWGGKKFLFFYISCGIGAAMLHIGMQYYEMQQVMENLNLNLNFDQLRALGSINLSTDMTYEELNKLMIEKKIVSNIITINEINNYCSVIGSMQGAAVGASGALYGIMVVFVFMFPNAEMMLLFFPFPIKAKFFVPALVLIDLYSGKTGHSLFGGGGIAHFAHIGGAITGLLIMYKWRKNKFNFKRWN